MVMQLQQQRILLAAFIILVLLFILTLFYAAWQWQADWRIAHQRTALSITDVKSNESGHLIAALPAAHLFGQSIARAVPISHLQLQVTGIVKVPEEKSGAISKAYISIASQPSKIYQVGDNLPYGVKVYEITTDTVILQKEDHLEKLPLPRAPLQFKQ